MNIQGATISGINIYGETPLYEFSTFTFTNGNSLGRTGPTVSNLRVLYNTVGNTWIDNNNYFNVIGGIQYWTVPITGTYTITARGAQGAPATTTGGGLGTVITGDFNLQQGQKLQILVGQSGRPPLNAASYGNSSSGGGGSFVVLNSGAVTTVANVDLLVAAGGGGGTGNVMLANSAANASVGLTGRIAWLAQAGGTAGMGGTTGTSDNGAGAGFWGNGAGASANGVAYRFGGNGGIINASYAPFGGGFGGGGSPNQGLFGRWSGGGGYSGGGATNSVAGQAPNAPANNQPYFGGGGGSYNRGLNQVNLGNASGNFGNGSVTITYRTSSSPAHTASGLVLYYNPNDLISYPSSGTTVFDLSGTSLNGTMFNVTFTPPYFNYNGTSGNIRIADTTSLEPGSGDFTLEAWVYYSTITGSTRTFVSKTNNGGGAADWSYGLRTASNGNTYFEVGNGTTSVTSPVFTASTGQWYQIVGVWTNIASNSIALYVNSVSQGSNSHSFTSVKNSTNPLYLGSYNGGEFSQWFAGQMGIFRYYNRALSAAEVTQNYNANRGLYGLPPP